MRDTFTKIIPNYHHEPKTCYQLVGQSLSHSLHPAHHKDVEGNSISKLDKTWNHKFDQIKTYNEEMLKLRTFAP